MVQHHPGSGVHALGSDLTNAPWALTTHLLSINLDQFERTTHATFLQKAAQGRLSKQFIGQWLANDRLYIQGYISLAESMLRLLKTSTGPLNPSDTESTESRLIRWLEAAIENVKREDAWFVEMTESYGLTATGLSGPNGTLSDAHKSRGLQLFESLFRSYSTNTSEYTFMPWLEGMVILWATEKVYYESWSWAQRQDAQASPKTYDSDLDGGAMRKEFIPNWSNKNFMMFVETLERTLNEAVSQAVGRDDARWQEVKQRTEVVWQATLDAEEAFWPDVALENGAVDGTNGKIDGSNLRAGDRDESLVEPRKETGTGTTGYVPHVG
jgi:thiaminase